MKHFRKPTVLLAGALILFTSMHADTLTIEGDLEVQGSLTNVPQTEPGSPTAGMVYFDSTSEELMVYNGQAWISATAWNTLISKGAGTNTVVIGLNEGGTIGGDHSVAWGSSAEIMSGSYNTVWGNSNIADGSYNTVWGKDSVASGAYTTAWGDGSLALGSYSTAWGHALTLAQYSTAWAGAAADGEYSTAVGYGSNTWGYHTIAMGYYVNANSISSFAVGAYNIGFYTEESPYVGLYDWLDLDPLFEIGNGSSDITRSNAITVLKNGRTTVTNKYWDSLDPSALPADPDPVINGDQSSAGEALVVEGHARFEGNVSLAQGVLVNGTIESTTGGIILPDGTIIAGASDLQAVTTPQTLSLSGDELTISEGNTISLEAISTDGATWLTGSGLPDDTSGADRDLYLDTSNGDYYAKASGTWGSPIGNLTGPVGPVGPAGADGADGLAGANGTDGMDGVDGATWLTGASDPTTEGVDDDLYLNISTGDYFTKQLGTWTLTGNLSGPEGPAGVDGTNGVNGVDGVDGVDGATWLTGSGVPDDLTGVDGDLYLDQSSGDYYVKSAGIWGAASGNLKGPQGDLGATGPEGPQGPSGDSYFAQDVNGNVTLEEGNLDVNGTVNVNGLLTASGGIIMTTVQGDIPMYVPAP